MEQNTSLQQQLLEAGVHFGHLKKKWNPKMLPYIFAEKKGIHIIDLNKTVEGLQESAAALKQIARSGKKILFVGTKKQAKDIDTNCDPNKVDFAVPANDDATKSIAIITNYITAAIAEGLAERQAAKEEEGDDAATDQENERRAARLEAEAQAEAGGRGRGGRG